MTDPRPPKPVVTPAMVWRFINSTANVAIRKELAEQFTYDMIQRGIEAALTPPGESGK